VTGQRERFCVLSSLSPFVFAAGMFARKTQFICPRCQRAYLPHDWAGPFEFCPACGYAPLPAELQAQVGRSLHWIHVIEWSILAALIGALIVLILKI